MQELIMEENSCSKYYFKPAMWRKALVRDNLNFQNVFMKK